ncbi:hypothetical protein JYB88_02970 [Shewanella cyperi]|uniref:Tail specific protease domain-containing protein n=1 Tax=Shewanella cyperi TaxID=2814292 RepID=A0A974XLL1_9GAMM|nr:S41 family peptidase [Shewanella cyperi]QSX30640.1 hypothetical protein JYB88_02970 [Shewanella cyperi]
MAGSSEPVKGPRPLSFRGVTACLCLLITLSTLALLQLSWPEPAKPQQLTAAEIAEDLYLLQQKLSRHSAFLALNGKSAEAKLGRASQALLKKVDGQLSNRRFAAELLRLLAPLEDPGLQLAAESLDCRQLPLQLRPMEHQWLALNETGAPLDADFPFITHIDGLPLERWIGAAQSYLPSGSKNSPGLLQPWLGRLGILRRDLGLPDTDSVLLGLSDGEFASRFLSLDLAAESPSQNMDEFPQATAWLAAYPEFKPLLQPLLSSLTLGRVNHEPAHEPRPMPSLQRLDPGSMSLTVDNLDALDTQASKALLSQALASPRLIVDLRHAHGHSPQLLSMLAGYAGESGSLLGFAHYRRGDTRSDFFGSGAFRILPGAVEPGLPESGEAFGPWYSRSLEGQSSRSRPDFASAPDTRLAIIAGPNCRQECEWIVHSAKHWARAVILGEATSGDLGKLYSLTLPNSRIRVSFSQSLAFAADGQLLSAVGTQPDINISSVDEPDWQGLLQLIDSEQLAQTSSSHGTGAR